MLTALFAGVAAVSAVAAPAAQVRRSTEPISIIHPGEGAVLPAGEGAFILGSVLDPKGVFTVNGQTVTTRETGAFLAWLPVAPATFTFNCNLALGGGTTSYHYQRTVFVTPPFTPLPQTPPAIDPDSLSPKGDLELRPGDWLLVRMRASPWQKARFRLPHRDWRPMREVTQGLGLYEGAYVVGPDERLEPSPVEYSLGSGWSSVGAKSKALVRLNPDPPLVAVAKGPELVGVKTGASEGELFHALPGTRFLTAGRNNSETKVALSGGQSGWIETKNLEFLPPGAQPPRAVTDTISVKESEGWTAVRIGLSDRVPFIVEESEDLKTLTVRLHYTASHTNWIVYDSADPLVEEVRVRQEAENLATVTIRVKPSKSIWGFHSSFEGSSLKVELREPPKIAPAPASALKGLKVFIDPGHMPSAPGAVGPLGTLEMDVNYETARRLDELLRKEGAFPIMSRGSNDDEAGLNDRPRMAWEAKADLFVSVHNNFLPDGTNPFKGAPHGYSVFYYQPQSLALGREVYKAYQKGVPIPGEELRFGNLLVLRETEMPAILTESAYLTYPEQEELLNERDFREKLARAILEGLRSFADIERARQAPPARVEKAAAPPAVKKPSGKPKAKPPKAKASASGQKTPRKKKARKA